MDSGRRARPRPTDRARACRNARRAPDRLAACCGRPRHDRRQGAEEAARRALRRPSRPWPTTSGATSTTSRSARGRDTLAYRAAKFVRRNRAPVALAALALAGPARRPRRHDHPGAAGSAAAVRRSAGGPTRRRARRASSATSRSASSRAPRPSTTSTRSCSPTPRPPGKPFTVGDLLARAEQHRRAGSRPTPTRTASRCSSPSGASTSARRRDEGAGGCSPSLRAGPQTSDRSIRAKAASRAGRRGRRRRRRRARGDAHPRGARRRSRTRRSSRCTGFLSPARQRGRRHGRATSRAAIERAQAAQRSSTESRSAPRSWSCAFRWISPRPTAWPDAIARPPRHSRRRTQS